MKRLARLLLGFFLGGSLAGCTLGIVPASRPQMLQMAQESYTSTGHTCENLGEVIACDRGNPKVLPLLITVERSHVGIATFIDAPKLGKTCAELGIGAAAPAAGAPPPVSCAVAEGKVERVLFVDFVDLPPEGMTADEFEARAAQFLAKSQATIDQLKGR